MNKNITRGKREEVKNLQERQEALQRSLKCYHEFGRNKVSLLTALQATHQFIRAGHPGGGGGEADSPSNCAMQVGHTVPSYLPAVTDISLQCCGSGSGSASFWSPGSASGSASNNNPDPH